MKPQANTALALGLLASIFVAGSASAGAQASAPHFLLAADNDRKFERQQAFGPGGQLVIDVNVADLVIRRGDSNTLKLVIDPRDSKGDPASWVREFTVTRQYGKVQLELPKHSGGGSSPHLVLYVPEQTSVRLSLSVGNLALDALSGNVEVDVGVGNVNVGALDAGKYHDVAASVSMGNISDNAFGMSTSGMLGKDASFHGSGQWKLKLHAKIGNIEIDKGDPGKGDSSDQ